MEGEQDDVQPQQTAERITGSWNEAFSSLAAAFRQFAQVYLEAVEQAFDAMRPNAYHPTGPVVRSTAQPLIEEDARE